MVPAKAVIIWKQARVGEGRSVRALPQLVGTEPTLKDNDENNVG
jgi:hypothetical protein